MSTVYKERRDRLREVLASEDIPAFITQNLVNARYLTGFTGSHATVLIGNEASEDVIFTDGRYITQVQQQCSDIEFQIESQSFFRALELVNKRGIYSCGIESEHVTLGQFRVAQKIFSGNLLELCPTVEKLRMMKDASEIADLTQACAISVAALEKLITHKIVGTTERALALQLENYMYECGGEGNAFETIVATGSHSAIPHHRPTDRTIAVGDLLKIDFGAIYHGYHADITRTFIVGKAQLWQKEIYHIVLQAQLAACEAVSVGMEYSALDAVARDIISDAGYGDNYLHSLGHGIGLEVHESPSIGAKSAACAQENEAITIEPGIYLADQGGVRIEDSLIITSNAQHILTPFPKELITLT